MNESEWFASAVKEAGLIRIFAAFRYRIRLAKKHNCFETWSAGLIFTRDARLVFASRCTIFAWSLDGKLTLIAGGSLDRLLLKVVAELGSMATPGGAMPEGGWESPPIKSEWLAILYSRFLVISKAGKGFLNWTRVLLERYLHNIVSGKAGNILDHEINWMTCRSGGCKNRFGYSTQGICVSPNG